MKLIVQIPCHNEADTLPETLLGLPRQVVGIDEIETLVIDDGSEDDTVRVAREHGVDHLVSLGRHRGLAFAWSAGMDAALEAGADVIVNTDADNQYDGSGIAELVRPILNGEADMVIGERQMETIAHFSWLKKRLQHIGSWMVSECTRVHVPDAACGFRAYSRDAALRLNIGGSYSHCIDTIIQASKKGIRIRSVPVRTNEKSRESRLMRNTLHYVVRQSSDTIRAVTLAHPLKVFGLAATLLVVLGMAGCARFLILFLMGKGSGHVQSLVLAAMVTIIGVVVGMIGLVADMVSGNRQLIEENLYQLKRLKIKNREASRFDDEADN